MAILPMAGWAHEDVLFVDDSIGHIEKARRARRTLLYSLTPCGYTYYGYTH